MAVRVLHGGWEVLDKECGTVLGGSADAEVKGCGLLVERLMLWLKHLTPRWCRAAGPCDHMKLQGLHEEPGNDVEKQSQSAD